MFVLKKSFSFEAAHRLPFHKGKCSRLHGHSWKLVVEVRGKQLIKEEVSDHGMVMDYAMIKDKVEPLVEKYLDHHYLNETTKLKSPTSENLCVWIFKQLKSKIPSLYAITIFETCTSQCRYCPYE